ncbi:MAG TPA: PRC-barrel domain containing protein [Lapillicoccus sp.]|jgi:hypothetical protein
MAGSSSQTEWDPWTHHSDVGLSGTGTWADLVGYEVEATDGHIGKIDEATYEVGSSYVVVDTGPWIFGSKVMLPAGTIDRLDRSNRRAYVACSKDEIARAPKFDKDAYRDLAYRDRVGEYYGKVRY